MAYTENKYTIVDGIDEAGNILVKEVIHLMKDGIPTNFKTYFRRVVHVGDDISKEADKIKVAATALWDKSKLDTITAQTITAVLEKKALIDEAITNVNAAIAELDVLIEAKKLKEKELETPV